MMHTHIARLILGPVGSSSGAAIVRKLLAAKIKNPITHRQYIKHLQTQCLKLQIKTIIIIINK
jgi:hypothetical protein